MAPVRVIVAESTRRNAFSLTARCKTLNGLDNIVARQEAQARGADDALLLNAAGCIAESTVANLFVVIDGRCVTPPVSDGALPGVMREDVLVQTDVDIRSLTPSDLRRASEAFLTNALGIRALIAVDGKAIGHGLPGPLTQSIGRRLN